MLNDEQKKVVDSNEPFLFLLAGAGSGKTRVIVEKIQRLIKEGVLPEHILAITFTRKASKEMKERINHSDVHIHTFHQLSLIRLKSFYKEDFKVIDGDIGPFNRLELLAITKYKNSYYQTKKPKYYEDYQQILVQNHMKDFDDLLIEYYELLRKKKIQENFQYIFVDEFQDTNRLQYLLLKALINQNTRVLAVGDPDQSIYQFRGANSKIIDQFVKDYQAKVYTLKINYRSDPIILEHANRIIKRNHRTYQKELIPSNQREALVKSILFEEELDEVKWIISTIKTLKEMKIKDHEIAILYRNHFRAFHLKEMLIEENISFETYDHESSYSAHGIQLLSIHKAKGLEFDVVFIMGLEQGIMPALKDYRQIALDEERRLMFVAITRARHILYLTTSKRHVSHHTFTSSQFIRECGLKSISYRHINDIISLGDFHGYKTKDDRTDPKDKSSKR
jgi:DNA helicase II / ATP-dependent DNA helicase PcrA